MLITPAFAQAATSSSDLFGSFGSFLPLILIFAVFYFLLIRPHQTKQKELRRQIAAVKRGDHVITAGGILGVVQRAREGAREVEVEIAPNVRVQIMRDTITSIVKQEAAKGTKAPAETKAN